MGENAGRPHRPPGSRPRGGGPAAGPPPGRLRTLGLALGIAAVLACGCDMGGPPSVGGARETGEPRSGVEGGEPDTDRRGAGGASEGPERIPGMDAEATMSTLLKPGLECWQAADSGVLYACSGDEDADLLYEARISGGEDDRVTGVEVRLSSRGTADLELATQPFLAFLSTQLEYEGSDGDQAYAFVNRNLDGEEATTTIGSARWKISTSGDQKTLEISPV